MLHDPVATFTYGGYAAQGNMAPAKACEASGKLEDTAARMIHGGSLRRTHGKELLTSDPLAFHSLRYGLISVTAYLPITIRRCPNGRM